MDAGMVTDCDVASVTTSEKLYEPAEVGIPPKYVVTPLLPGSRMTPGGSVDPGATDQVNGAVPV
jgi:hypothetical protein